MPTNPTNASPEVSKVAEVICKVDELDRRRTWLGRLLRRAFPGQAKLERLLFAALASLDDEAARGRASLEAERKRTTQVELLASGLRNSLRACEALIDEQGQTSIERYHDVLRSVLRLDQLAGEIRGDLAALMRAQAGTADSLADAERRHAAVAESIRAETAALGARLEVMVRAAAEQRDDTLRRLVRLDQLAGEVRGDLSALGQAQAKAADSLAEAERRHTAAEDSIHAETAALRAQLGEAGRAAAVRHEDALRRLLWLDQLADGTRRDVAKLGQAQAQAAGHLAEVEQRFAAAAESIRVEVAALEGRLAEAAIHQQVHNEAIESSRRQMTAMDGRLSELAEAVRSSDIPERLVRLDRRLQAVETDPTSGRLFDDFYIAFEDRFRGAREEIASRQRVYLPYLESAGVLGTGRQQGARLVDLGCGRGEWIELLREAGASGILGVDRSTDMIEHCRQRGLPVEQADVMDYLCNQPDRSLAAITAMHIAEHLPFTTLLAVLREARRILEPGGLLVIETPNCDNVLVATRGFHLDPTHRSPLPPLLLEFSVQQSGFSDISTLLLHPYGPESRVTGPLPLADRFNDFFYGPQDYAVVAHNA